MVYFKSSGNVRSQDIIIFINKKKWHSVHLFNDGKHRGKWYECCHVVCPLASRLPVRWASGRPERKAWYCWEYSTSMSDTDLSMYIVFSYFLRNPIGLASLSSTVPSSFLPRHSSFSSVSSQLRFVCFCHWLKKIISLKRNSGPSRLLEFHKFSLKKGIVRQKRMHS